MLWDSVALDNPAIALFLEQGFVEDRRIDEAIYLRKDLSQGLLRQPAPSLSPPTHKP